MPVEQNEIFRNVDGDWVGTGLWVPDEKDKTLELLSSQLTARLDEKDCREALKYSRRKTGRQRFPGKVWTRNQGRRGSCNGYAFAGTLGKARVQAGQPRVHLSGEFVYAHINRGRDQGSGLQQGREFVAKGGACSEDLVQREEYLLRNISQAAKDDAKNHIAVFPYAVATELEMVQALVFLGDLLVVAVHFSGAMQRLDSEGVAGSSRGVGNHSVGVDDVRWNERKGRWEFDMQNSHGLRYGEDGKAWITWDEHLAQPNRHHSFTAVRYVKDDPRDDSFVPDPRIA